MVVKVLNARTPRTEFLVGQTVQIVAYGKRTGVYAVLFDGELEYCNRVLPLHSASLGDEYYYQSLPLCIIDAVFSINVKYQSTQNVVSRYCQHFGLRKFRRDRTSIPSREEQESVSALCERYIERGFGVMTEEILDNRQRTSAVNGITKVEAVLEFAATLKKYGIEYFQDIGARQGRCRLIHAAKRCFSAPGLIPVGTAISRSGLSVTVSIGDQSRVSHVQRRGLRSRA